jgi:hypothetical protein
VNKDNSTKKNEKKKHVKKGSIDGGHIVPKFNGLLGDDDVNNE